MPGQPPGSGTPYRLGIRTCLLAERVRYDGGHQLDRYRVHTLGRYVEWVPVQTYLNPYPKERMLRNRV